VAGAVGGHGGSIRRRVVGDWRDGRRHGLCWADRDTAVDPRRRRSNASLGASLENLTSHSVSSCGYSGLGVYLVDRSFPIAIVGWIPTSSPPTRPRDERVVRERVTYVLRHPCRNPSKEAYKSTVRGLSAHALDDLKVVLRGQDVQWCSSRTETVYVP
jgi:hypothetical protein